MKNRKMIYLDDAIDALERKKDKKAKGDIGGFYNKIIQNDIDALMQLPPAQPERKKGRWVKHDTSHSIYYDCSLCGCVAPCAEVSDNFIWKLSAYCPDCGADMRGIKDGCKKIL